VDVASQGSVIFLLLTDIIGSTRLSRAFPREYLEAEVVHDGLVSDAIAKHGGAVHLRTGDGYWAVFGSARASAFPMAGFWKSAASSAAARPRKSRTAPGRASPSVSWRGQSRPLTSTPARS
jgi:class 3 adenylate cyclase